MLLVWLNTWISVLLLVFCNHKLLPLLTAVLFQTPVFLTSFSFVSIFRFPFCLNTRCLKMQQSSVVCCQDHNYGAPPPPTPPASPLSQTIIPRMDLNGMVRGSCYHETPEDNSADSDSSSEEDGAVASWCHCSLTPDGLLIKCDNCRWGMKNQSGSWSTSSICCIRFKCAMTTTSTQEIYEKGQWYAVK